MTKIEKAELIKSRGWYRWYNPDYWCHAQFSNKKLDCTNWGMTLDEAYSFETNPVCRANRLAAVEVFSKILEVLAK